MATGPEAKVKRAVRSALDALGDVCRRFTPATGGFGKSGVSDEAGSLTVGLDGVLGASGPTAQPYASPTSRVRVALAFYIECKGTDKGEPTTLQDKWLRENADGGAFCAVCRPSRQTLYLRDGHKRDYRGTPSDLVQTMVSLNWIGR